MSEKENGFFKVPRRWYRPAFTKAAPATKNEALIDLLGLASWGHTKGLHVFADCPVDIAPGDIAKSLNALARRWHWDDKKVKRFLDRLVRDGLLECREAAPAKTPKQTPNQTPNPKRGVNRLYSVISETRKTLNAEGNAEANADNKEDMGKEDGHKEDPNARNPPPTPSTGGGEEGEVAHTRKQAAPRFMEDIPATEQEAVEAARALGIPALFAIDRWEFLRDSGFQADGRPLQSWSRYLSTCWENDKHARAVTRK